uniref:RNA-directed RNA polymerase n=1 Tax=Erysiphales associated mitovirus 1 TaxID=2719863 RepID=A0A6G9ELM3_9VIRU|nr:RNA-dependent RNA polymerase [Erysiphales associated mitovirus 1]
MSENRHDVKTKDKQCVVRTSHEFSRDANKIVTYHISQRDATVKAIKYDTPSVPRIKEEIKITNQDGTNDDKHSNHNIITTKCKGCNDTKISDYFIPDMNLEIVDAYLDEDYCPCDVLNVRYVVSNVRLITAGEEQFRNSVIPHKSYVNTLAGETCFGILKILHNIAIYYVDIKLVTKHTPKTAAIIGAHIGGNFRCGLNVGNHSDFYDETALAGLVKHKSKLSKEEFTYIREAQSTQISQNHHKFLTHNELIPILKELQNGKHDKNVNKDEVNEKIGAIKYLVSKADMLEIGNEVSLNTHIVYILVAPIFAVRLLVRFLATVNTPDEYNFLLKQESQAAKQLQHLFRNDLSVVFELNVLRNRIYDNVDWRTEKLNRTNPDTVNISSTDVYKLARQIFSDSVAENRHPMNIKWDDYWDMRWVKMPTGSIVSQYEEDKDIKKKLAIDARTKSVFFSTIKQPEYAYWFNRRPEIYATASVKYEWGKVRALYGCDVTSFLHANYAFSNCENILPCYFPVGDRANDKYVTSLLKSFERSIPFCFDFDDFNSQHSTSSMKAVIQAYIDIFSKYLSEEQVDSARWTMESVGEMFIENHYTKDKYKANGTLMSGWRLTAFMNTVLNRIYLLHADLSSNVIYAVHNGDDMYAGVNSIGQAMTMMKNAKDINIRAQTAKTNIGTIGEFLRVDIRSEQSNTSQYLSRSVSTATHGRIETAKPNDIASIINAYQERMTAIKMRGGDPYIASLLHSKSLEFIKRRFNVSAAVTEAFNDHHPIQGGVNPDVGVRTTKLVRKKTGQAHPWRLLEKSKSGLREELTVEKELIFEQKVFKQMITPGIYDYKQYVLRKFNIENMTIFEELDSLDKMCNMAIEAIRNDYVTYDVIPENDKRIGYYIGMYKAYSDTTFVIPFSKLRMLGLNFILKSGKLKHSVKNLIINDDNPLKLMSAIFWNHMIVNENFI